MTVVVQKLGDNVVDFVFKTLSQSPRLWGTWVGNLVDNPLLIKVHKTLSLTVTPLTSFPKGILPTGLSGSWDLADFGCR